MIDLGFTEQQKLMQHTIREFLAKECPRELVRDIEDNKRDYSPEMYRKMADLGWLGLLIPEQYGGIGGNWVDGALFYEEAGRALLPGPHWSSAVLGSQAVLTFGNERQRGELLPKIAEGEIIITVALAEPEFRCDITELSTTAKAQGGSYLVNGTKIFVTSGHLADRLIVVARMEGGGGKAVSLFLVEPDAPGVAVTPMQTLGGERLSEVVLDNVQVPGDSVLGSIGDGEGIEEVVDKANLMLAAEMLGGAQVALNLAVEYSKQRIAFDKPIGAFQALQHKMANILVEIECARGIIYYAAWLTSQGRPAAAERAMAQFQAGEAYGFATREATQIFGGVGVMKDADITLHFRRAKMRQLSLAPPEVLRERMLAPLAI